MGQVPRVFISYSHDSENHKAWVLNLSTRLRANGVDVVLDQWDVKLGSDIAKFIELGLSGSDRIIMICTEHYVEKADSSKGGVGYEKMIMTAELMEDLDSNKIIPLLRNNNTKKTPKFIGGRRYIDFNLDKEFEKKYEELIRDIHVAPLRPKPQLGPNPFLKNDQPEIKPLKFQTGSEKYVSASLRGKVTFDYSNNNGNYIIGTGDLVFETCWSKASDTSIHTYNDRPSIASIGLAIDVKEISEIIDATRYDMSSRSRTPREGEIVVARNQNGYYAALKVLDVKDRTRVDDKDELTFEYVILSNRTVDFSVGGGDGYRKGKEDLSLQKTEENEFDVIVRPLQKDYLLENEDNLKQKTAEIVQDFISRGSANSTDCVSKQLQAHFKHNNKLIDHIIESLKQDFADIPLVNFKEKLFTIVDEEYKKLIPFANSRLVNAGLASPSILKSVERQIGNKKEKAKQTIETRLAISEKQRARPKDKRESTETEQGKKDAKSEGEEGFIDNTKPTIKKLLSKNFIKATIKHFPYCGSYLFDIIYGVDGMKEQNKKIDISTIARDNIDRPTPKAKKEKSGWGKNIGIILVYFAAIATILILLFGDNIWGRFNRKPKSSKPAVEQIKTSNLSGNSVDVNKIVFDTRPTANEIIAEIERLPVFEQKVAAENYIGRTFKWRLRFDFLVHEEGGMVYVLCKTSSGRGEVDFDINADAKENLKIKKIKKGKFLDVSGEIMDILLDREPQIGLKDVRLEFVD